MCVPYSEGKQGTFVNVTVLLNVSLCIDRSRAIATSGRRHSPGSPSFPPQYKATRRGRRACSSVCTWLGNTGRSVLQQPYSKETNMHMQQRMPDFTQETNFHFELPSSQCK